MKRAIVLLLLAPTACSVLNTMGMSKDCKDAYDACLDGCPKPPPNLDNDPQGQVDTTTPSCVEACNHTVSGCK